MWIEYAAFILTFIVSAGLSAIGIMLSHQFYREHQKPIFQTLLYQQIFLISFFVYAIWGNLSIHEFIRDLDINDQLYQRLSALIPILGIPFLLISWLMLLQFSRTLNGIETSARFSIVFFTGLISAFFVFMVLINKEIIVVHGYSNLFVVKTITFSNLAIHILFLFPFLKRRKDTGYIKETGFSNKCAALYFIGVAGYSLVLVFFDIFNFVVFCIATVLMFAASISIPIFIKLNRKIPETESTIEPMDFVKFCSNYEISKREAEIVLEICSGKTNKAIAEKLFITLQTVKDHNYRIYSKLDVKTRVQLTNMVREKTGM